MNHSLVKPLNNFLYPFSAIVGQERMKLALLLNAVDPAIGGVLIRGERGTAKSTAARALAGILPEIAVHAGCAFACDPSRPAEWCATCRAQASKETLPRLRRKAAVVTLPLSATEDMVAGGLDFSATMKDGMRVFQPGLLARAHRGILYIDEVNLLDDHLVDIILDAAESGVNTVEREGLSFRHQACFAIVASMNPEEGPLRPQLLDRFGLCVEVVSEAQPAGRVQLIERREAFETDPFGFCRSFADEESTLSCRVAEARRALRRVGFAPHLRKYISEMAMSRNVAGHRADLVMVRAALAHAALFGKDKADIEDVLAIAEMALLHRGRDVSPPPPYSSPPPDNNGDGEPGDPPQFPEKQQTETGAQTGAEPDNIPVASRGELRESEQCKKPESAKDETHFEVGGIFRVKPIEPVEDRFARRGSGRRTRTRTEDKQGRYVRNRYRSVCDDVAIDATLRAAAPYQISRRASTDRKNVIIYRQDWREKIREKRIGTFILFVVDGSGSMGARGRMTASKGAVMSLLLDAYQKRDRLAMIGFRRREATLILPPTSSVELAGKLLREMTVGGRTPLSAALVKSWETLRPQFLKNPNLRPVVILITDGKANVPLDEKNRAVDEALHYAGHIGLDNRIRWVVVDTEERTGVCFGLAQRIAAALGGEYYLIDDLKASHLVNVVKGS